MTGERTAEGGRPPSPASVIDVPRDLADRFDAVVLRMPEVEDAELRAPRRQQELLSSCREECGLALEALLEDLRARLVAAPHFALVRGLGVASPGLALVAISAGLGTCVEPYRESWSRLVRRIEARRERLAYGGRSLNEFAHTDGTDWSVPNDYTCLLCVRPDAGQGGSSVLIGVDEVVAELTRAHGADVVETLRMRQVPWKLADSLGGGTAMAPPLGEGRLRWLRYTIEAGVEALGTPLEDDVAVALDALEDTVEGSVRPFVFDLRPGDLLVVDNRRCLHARTPIPDHERSGRLLPRTKVMREDPGP